MLNYVVSVFYPITTLKEMPLDVDALKNVEDCDEGPSEYFFKYNLYCFLSSS